MLQRKNFINNKKKNCLNCVFCLRNRVYNYSGYMGMHPYSKELIEPLSDVEREEAKSNNYDFIGKKIRAFEEWNKKYEKALEEKDLEIDNSTMPDFRKIIAKSQYRPNLIIGQNSPNATEILGIEKRPSNVPEEDYISCWQGQWNEDKNPELINQRTILQNKNCAFFYAYSKIGTKTLEACEKERIEEQKRQDDKNITIKNSLIYLFIAFLGLPIGIGVYKYQVWDAEQKKTKIVDNKPLEIAKSSETKAKQTKVIVKQATKPNIKKPKIGTKS